MPKTLPPVDDDVFEALQRMAEPLIDDINSVLRRVLGLAPNSNGERPALSDKAALGGLSPRSAPTPSRRSGRTGKTPTRRAKSAKRQRAAKGTLLPKSEYEVPFLEVVAEFGGRAPASEVIEEVGRRLKDRLKPADHELLDSGLVRWKNRVQFVRLRLVRNGDMAKDAPRGVWEITQQGRTRIDQA